MSVAASCERTRQEGQGQGQEGEVHVHFEIGARFVQRESQGASIAETDTTVILLLFVALNERARWAPDAP